jgi:hypothetical protein
MSEPTDEREVWEVLDRILGELDPDAIREHTYPCQDCDGGCEVCDG